MEKIESTSYALFVFKITFLGEEKLIIFETNIQYFRTVLLFIKFWFSYYFNTYIVYILIHTKQNDKL